MQVIYIDSVFCLNALMDALVLLATAQLGGICPKRGRCFWAAILGGVYSVAVFLPGGEVLASWLGKAVAGTLMVLTAYGGERHILRVILLFFGVSCGMAGCVMALGAVAGGIPLENGVLYTNVDVGVLLSVSAAAYGVLTLVFRASAGKRVRGLLVPVTLAWDDRRVHLTVLCDTGNSLRDPVTGRTVLIADSLQLRELFPVELRPLLHPERLRSPAELPGMLGEWRVRFRLIPYRAVGVSGGMLVAFKTDWGEVGGRRYDRLMVALSPTELGDGYAGLWGAWEGSEGNGKDHRMHSFSAGQAGIDATAKCFLHLRS